MRLHLARCFLYMKVMIWRGLMAVGMKLHKFADPRPPSPNFKITIPSRLSPRGGTFKLVFYVPSYYLDAPDDYRFPVVVNFHGGGFTLGTGTDDSRWATSVVDRTGAVVVSVEYRLAPEYPFSVGVEDGTDALLYLAFHADDLRIDPNRIALSGFSAGGNLALTVPLMLHDLKNDVGKRCLSDSSKKPSPYASSSNLSLPRTAVMRSQSSNSSTLKFTDLEPTAREVEERIPEITIQAIVSFYPPTDFRPSRDSKRATNPSPATNLSPMLTDLFDESYLFPAGSVDVSDPYLSPSAASDELLTGAYPQDIVLFTCEYDMLNEEGVAFGKRLSRAPIQKTVHGGVILASEHAFDKKPNPLHFPEKAVRCYEQACAELNRVFGGTSLDDTPLIGRTTAAPRSSEE